MTTAPVPLVAVVDDDRSVRASLARLLRGAGYEVIVAASAREFFSHPSQEIPACLVLDVVMPGISGLEMQQLVTSGGRRPAIVFITGHPDVRTTVRAMKHGAVDFFSKPVKPSDLLGAIARGVAQFFQVRREDAAAGELTKRIQTLTHREGEVFALVVTGMLNKQIGWQLGIREKTVKVHRGQVMLKMGAGSLAELVQLASQAGAIAMNGASVDYGPVAERASAVLLGPQLPDTARRESQR